MVSCSSCGCSLTPKHKNSGVTFHSFPKDDNKRTQWINFVKESDFIPKRSSVLCSHHFAKDCFDRTSKVKVRLFPNAIPTIEVDRLKYVRTFNPLVTRSVKDVKNKLTDPDILPRPSVEEHTSSSPPGLSFIELEDTLHKKNLNRRISDLQKINILKSDKICRLQKVNWRQKKQISLLKAKVFELKNKNLLLEKQKNMNIL